MRRLQRWLVFYPFGIEMPFGADIGPGLKLPHLNGIILSSGAVIGSGCTIYHQVTLGVNEHSKKGAGPPTVGNGVYIGAGAKVIGPVRIGDCAVVGANAVVVRDVAPGEVFIGKGL